MNFLFNKYLFIFFIFSSFFYAFISFYFSNLIVHFQTRTLDEDRIRLNIKSYSDFNLSNPEEVHIPSNNVIISGWLFEKEKQKCSIIFSHGHAGNRYGMLKYTRAFKDKDCQLLLIDARYHGNSTGNYGTYGYYEKYDLLNVAKWIEKNMQIPTSKIGLVGESYGASISIMATGLDTNFWFVVADSPYKDIKTILTERAEIGYTKVTKLLFPFVFWLSEKRANFSIDDVSTVKYANKSKTPILLIHSKQDTETPLHHSKDIYTSIPTSNKKIIITDWNAEHTKSIDVNYDEYKSIVDKFINSIN